MEIIAVPPLGVPEAPNISLEESTGLRTWAPGRLRRDISAIMVQLGFQLHKTGGVWSTNAKETRHAFLGL